jgi:hypothetical protein
VVQIFPKEFEPLSLANLHLSDQRKYGSTVLCFYESSAESGCVPAHTSKDVSAQTG